MQKPVPAATGWKHIDELGAGLLFAVKITLDQPHFMEAVCHRDAQYAAAVLHAALEVDARRFRKILCRTGHFGYFITVHKYLRYHFIVENEIIAVVGKVDRPDHICPESPVTGMILAELLPQH